MSKTTKPYQLTTLKSGLRIVTVPLPHTETVTVMTLVGTGSHYEPRAINGISHFLEHICFKGTKQRTVSEIAHELDSLGAESNAFTSTEVTGYYAKAHFRHFNTIVDIISDISINPTFPEAELKKERGVILEELHMYEDLPQRKVWDVFEELVYGDQPAGRAIVGTPQSLKSINRAKMVAYHQKQYAAANTVVVVAGKIDVPQVLEKVTQSFKDLPHSKSEVLPKIKEIQTRPAIKIKKRKTDQTHLVLGCRSFGCHDKRTAVANITAAILGKGFSSRLFKEMRDERGMCYYVHAGNNTENDVGIFTISAGVNVKRLPEAVEVITRHLRRLKEEPVAEKELAKAKEYAVGTLTLAHESSDSFAQFYGMQVLFRERPVKTLHEEIDALRRVTANDIQKFAQDIFKDSGLNLAVIGDVTASAALHEQLHF